MSILVLLRRIDQAGLFGLVDPDGPVELAINAGWVEPVGEVGMSVDAYRLTDTGQQVLHTVDRGIDLAPQAESTQTMMRLLSAIDRHASIASIERYFLTIGEQYPRGTIIGMLFVLEAAGLVVTPSSTGWWRLSKQGKMAEAAWLSDVRPNHAQPSQQTGRPG